MSSSPHRPTPEKTGTYTNTNRQIQLGRAVLAPPGEARPDWALIQEMARGLGLDWNYGHPREVYGEMSSLMPSLANIPWERLEREDAVTYPAKAEDAPGQEILFAESFPTPSGRGRLVPADLTPPAELPDEAYPWVLSTGRLLEHWHTGAMTRRASSLDALEPEAVAILHPEGLRADGGLGWKQGARLHPARERGAPRAPRPAGPGGMVFIPFCFNEAPANLLTHPQPGSVREDPGVQVLRRQGGALAGNGAGAKG